MSFFIHISTSVGTIYNMLFVNNFVEQQFVVQGVTLWHICTGAQKLRWKTQCYLKQYCSKEQFVFVQMNNVSCVRDKHTILFRQFFGVHNFLTDICDRVMLSW
jgi:hypothetical protein